MNAFGPFVLLLTLRPASLWRLPFWPVALVFTLVFALGALVTSLGYFLSGAAMAGLRWLTLPSESEGGA